MQPVTVTELPGAERYYFADQIVVTDDAQAFLDRMLEPTEWSPRVAFVSSPVRGGAPGEIRVLRERANFVALDASASADALLVRTVTPQEAVQTLVWFLTNDKDWGVKRTAASLLGGMGAAAKPAVPYLKQCAAPCCDEIYIPEERMKECMACEDTRSVCQQSLSALTK